MRLIRYTFLALFLLPATFAHAQDSSDEFVLFVDGTNPAVPEFQGAEVADAANAENIVAQFTYAGWSNPSFVFTSDASPEGADMSVARTAGQTLYLRLKVDPVFNQAGALCEGNASSGVGDPMSDVNSCLALSFFDYSAGNGAADDREGRLKWRIPEAMRDGAWHDLAIPLPPVDWVGLEAAQAAAAPEDVINLWAYAGGWTPDITGWGGVDASMPGPLDTAHWQEFQWDKVTKFGVHFDFNDGKFDGGTVEFDNVYVGDEDTDLNPPADEFVMFVNGVHPSVVQLDANVSAVTDADDAENVVAEFTYGGWSNPSFEYVGTDSPEGVDMTGAVGAEAGQGQNLYVRLKVDPTFNAEGALCEGNGSSGVGDPMTDVNSCLALSFFDYSNGGLATDDREGRLKWRIPEAMRDGAWHELVIPMPPDSWDGLENAKAAADPADLIHFWAYAGGWTSDITGWGGVDASMPGPADTDHWQDFQWDKISKVGIHFDFNDDKFANATVQLDNFYIGDENTVLGGIKPAPMSGVTFMAQEGYNEVSWTHNPLFGGYSVYWSWEAITEANIGDATKLADVGADAAEFRVEHKFTIPHPSAVDGPVTLHYAVTSAAEDGTANNDVSNSSGSIENGNLASRPAIPVIDADQAITIYDNIFGTPAVTNDGFPESDPFVIMSDDAADLSLKLWAAVEANEVDGDGIYFYAEVMDSEISVIGSDGSPDSEFTAGNEAWNYDSIELGWGSYDVRDEGGDAFNSPHATFGTGTVPDYQFRLAPYGANNASAEITGAVPFFAANQPGPPEGEYGIPPASDAHAEVMTDGAGNVVGWKILAYIPFSSIAVSGQSVFTPPAADAIMLVPFQISVNDAEAGAARETQLHWSPIAGGDWWQKPNEWLPTAVTGGDFATDVAENMDTPFTYELGQNYPNPFNPSTTISFSLANSSEVSLEVFNLLGQRVATLVNGVPMAAGSHQVQFDASDLASGMYLMRLDAGSAFSQTRSMMLLK